MNFSNAAVRKNEKIMQEGDLVILYERHDSLTYIYLCPSQTFQNKFGRFPHSDMIGLPFGSKIKSSTYDGYVFALEPTPDLWSHALDHRTQIVDSSDASFIVLQLDLFPGCVVVESGTGSGNMTVNFARTVAPNGQVHTFEYNADRARIATQEFEQLGLSSLVSVTCRDVCGTKNDSKNNSAVGFDGVQDNSVDGVFLDLPAPWLAISHAYRVLKPGRSICCYSPCVEQVIKTCDKLREFNFHSIKMFEVRQRQFDGRIIQMPTPDLGESAISPLPPKCITTQEETNEDSSNNGTTEKADSSNNGTTEKAAFEEKNTSEEDMDTEPASKRRRNEYKIVSQEPTTVTVARPMGGMKGHTAFLTFAVCPCKDKN